MILKSALEVVFHSRLRAFSLRHTTQTRSVWPSLIKITSHWRARSCQGFKPPCYVIYTWLFTLKPPSPGTTFWHVLLVGGGFLQYFLHRSYSKTLHFDGQGWFLHILVFPVLTWDLHIVDAQIVGERNGHWERDLIYYNIISVTFLNELNISIYIVTEQQTKSQKWKQEFIFYLFLHFLTQTITLLSCFTFPRKPRLLPCYLVPKH